MNRIVIATLTTAMLLASASGYLWKCLVEAEDSSQNTTGVTSMQSHDETFIAAAEQVGADSVDPEIVEFAAIAFAEAQAASTVVARNARIDSPGDAGVVAE